MSTREFLDEIAAEYAKGRLLLVGTTNLDSLEPVIWNMTAIAASQDPRAAPTVPEHIAGFRFHPGCLSAGNDRCEPRRRQVPGNARGWRYDHAGLPLPAFRLSCRRAEARAGGSTSFAMLGSIPTGPAPSAGPCPSPCGPSIPSPGRKASATCTGSTATTQRDGVDFNLTFIPSTFTVPHTEQFGTAYMRALYDVGFEAAKAGYKWQKYPPGFEAPVQAAPAARK